METVLTRSARRSGPPSANRSDSCPPWRSSAVPASGVTSPARQRRTVVLPDPDSPMMPSASLRATSNPTSWQARTRPKLLVRPVTRSAGSVIGLDLLPGAPPLAPGSVAADPAVVGGHLDQVGVDGAAEQAGGALGPLDLEGDVLEGQRLDVGVGRHRVYALLPPGPEQREE